MNVADANQLQITSFEGQILYFNGMYRLPIARFPSMGVVAADVVAKNPGIKSQRQAIIKRLQDFRHTLGKELDECEDIVAKIATNTNGIQGKEYTELEFLVDLADWLADIQVYCASEMAKFGIPNSETLKIVMSSNFSKLGENGEPIYDDKGKVLKGPGYWKPEPQIKLMLEELIQERKEQQANGIVWRD